MPTEESLLHLDATHGKDRNINLLDILSASGKIEVSKLPFKYSSEKKYRLRKENYGYSGEENTYMCIYGVNNFYINFH